MEKIANPSSNDGTATGDTGGPTAARQGDLMASVGASRRETDSSRKWNGNRGRGHSWTGGQCYVSGRSDFEQCFGSVFN